MQEVTANSNLVRLVGVEDEIKEFSFHDYYSFEKIKEVMIKTKVGDWHRLEHFMTLRADELGVKTKFKNAFSKVKKEIEEEKGKVNRDLKKKQCIFTLVKLDKNEDIFYPKNVQENIEIMLNAHNIKVRYNEMSKEIEYSMKGINSMSVDNRMEVALEQIYDLAILNDFRGLTKERLISVILKLADENRINPIKEYIINSHNKFDKNELRKLEVFNKMSDILVVPAYFNNDLKNTMFKRWLVGCVVAVFTKKGAKIENVLVLQGKQGALKTTFLKNLSPKTEWFIEGQTLDPSDKDSIFQSIKYWLVELGEVESTMKKELNRLKAFLSKQVDELRRPYAKGESKYPRRTVFCATANSVEFLKDETGNRRWWVVPIDERNEIDVKKQSTLDLEKFWAEIYQLYLDGEKHYFDNSEEMSQLNTSNKMFEEKNYTETIIESTFNFDTKEYFWLTSSDIIREGMIKNISATSITKTCRRIGLKETTGRGRKTYFAIPFKYCMSREDKDLWIRSYKVVEGIKEWLKKR